jgi:carboxymethylenebutenolidase
MMKTTLCLLALALTAGPLAAQPWAVAKLDKSPRHGEFVKLKHDSRDVEAFITYPEVRDKATTVVVVHEIFGMSDWAREMTDELAAEGYIAIVPDLVSGAGTNGGGTAELGGQSAVIRAVSRLPADQVVADIQSAVDYAAKLPAGNGKVVVMGFCWGGGQAFNFATRNKDIKAVLSFYGNPPTDDAALARIACPVYGFYGQNDNRVSALVPKATDQMKAAGKTYEPVIYPGADHGFMRDGETPDSNDQHHAENVTVHDQAWVRVRQILKGI